MREAPLNVGTIIDADLAWMGYPYWPPSTLKPVLKEYFETATHKSRRQATEFLSELAMGNTRPCLVTTLMTRDRRYTAALRTLPRRRDFLVLTSAQQILRQGNEALQVALQFAAIF
jgi:hypothetical protein